MLENNFLCDSLKGRVRYFATDTAMHVNIQNQILLRLIYARTANKDDIALAFQIEKLSDYANKNNLVIAGITAESVAGLSCNRLGLKETLQAIRSHQADTVLVTDLSRIGRSIPDVIEWQSRVCEEGGAVVSMQDNMFNYMKTHELLKLYFEQSCR